MSDLVEVVVLEKVFGALWSCLGLATSEEDGESRLVLLLWGVRSPATYKIPVGDRVGWMISLRVLRLLTGVWSEKTAWPDLVLTMTIDGEVLSLGKGKEKGGVIASWKMRVLRSQTQAGVTEATRTRIKSQNP